MDAMTFIKPLLKRRFTAHGMWIENYILDYLGHKYYQGDRVVWESNRRRAYHMWNIGKSIDDISFYFELPTAIVVWWVEIWERYNKAWERFK